MCYIRDKAMVLDNYIIMIFFITLNRRPYGGGMFSEMVIGIGFIEVIPLFWNFHFMFQLLGIICMACASPALLTGTHWFLFVAVLSFIATLIWVFIYLLSIKEALTLPINWLLTVGTHGVEFFILRHFPIVLDLTFYE